MKSSGLVLMVVGVVLSAVCGWTAEVGDIPPVLTAFQIACDTILLDEQERLDAITHTPAAQRGEWEGIKTLLTYHAADRIKTLYWYALPDGSYYTSEKDKVSATLSSRTYFPALIGGKSVVGELIVGKTSGLASTVVAVPIKQDGQVTGVLGSSIFLDELTDQVVSDLVIPADMVCFTLGPDGRTALDTGDKALILDDAQQQNQFPSLQKAISEIMENDSGEVSYGWDGNNKVALYQRSPQTQWRYVVSKVVK